MQKIAIIGAGITSAILANKLKDKADIVVFEKSRGVGGRMATRRLDEFNFDHGVPFFTRHDKKFKEFTNKMLQLGVIEQWDARFVEIDDAVISKRSCWGEIHPHYVAVPQQNSLVKHLLQKLK